MLLRLSLLMLFAIELDISWLLVIFVGELVGLALVAFKLFWNKKGIFITFSSLEDHKSFISKIILKIDKEYSKT
jgi:hypothetical protein